MKRCFLYLLLTPTLVFAAEPQLSAGFGEVDVSPKLGNKPLYMAGFGTDRKATKVHDPIMARAVVLSDGSKKIGLVCVDVVGLFHDSAQRVRKQLKGFDYVMVSSTHNHEAPDTLGLWGANPFVSGVDADYLKLVETGAAKALQLADKALSPAVAKVGSAKGPELLQDGRLPEVLHDDLIAIRFDPVGKEKDDAKPLGILIEWNVHPELMDSKNTEITSDHVGYTVKHVAGKFQCPVAYFTGTVGGLMTSLKVPLKDKNGKELKDGTFEKTEAYGVAVGQLTEKALDNAAVAKLVPFELRSQQVLVPVENKLYKLGWQVGVLKRSMYKWEGNATPKEYVQATDISKPVALLTELGYLKLGELEVALIPGEIYPELVLGKVQDPADKNADFPDAPIEPSLYGPMKAKHKMIIGLANDEIGYIIPKRQWDDKAPFCYGLKKAQYGEVNSCGPDIAPIICGEFQKLLKK